jgi:hypothetical protein
MKEKKTSKKQEPDELPERAIGEIVLTTFEKAASAEAAVGACVEALEGKHGKSVEEVLVAFRDLTGALYHPRTRTRDYYEDAPEQPRPGRISAVYNPVYMRDWAISAYVRQCSDQGSLPVILADADTLERRKVPTDRGQSAPEFTGIIPFLEELAKAENMTLDVRKAR